MAQDATLIVARIIDIRIATQSTALPSIANPMVWDANWTQPGTPTGEVSLELSETRAQFKPHDELGITKEVVLTKGLKATFTLGETAADQLQIAMTSSALAAGVLSDGGSDAVVYKSLCIETPNGVWHLKRVSGDGNAPVAIPDDDFATFQVVVNGFHDVALALGVRLWEFHDFDKLGV